MTLRITSDQLGELASRGFENRIIGLIAKHDKQALADLDTPEGRAELRRQCERARGYGLSSSPDLARYVVTAWLMGASFDTENGAMQEVLTSPQVTPKQKAEAIGKITVAVLCVLAKG